VISFYIHGVLTSSPLCIQLGRGAVKFELYQRPSGRSFEIWTEFSPQDDDLGQVPYVRPSLYRDTFRQLGVPETELTIPIWYLAFLCLACYVIALRLAPVTSFLLARRRRGTRGFEVEVAAAGSPPLPPGEVPSPRGPEGGHQDAPD
jgi:hypothetical protein